VILFSLFNWILAKYVGLVQSGLHHHPGLHPSDIVRFGYLSDSSMEVDLRVEVKDNVTTFDKIQGI
jgi:hypothetical protein